MPQLRTIALSLLSLCFIAASTDAQDSRTITFDNEKDAAAWKLEGGAKFDAEAGRAGGALVVPPGGKATLLLRDTNAAGKVDLYIFDDMTAPAKDKDRRTGPRWGVVQTDGRAVVIGAIYAPYLAGKETLATAEYEAAKGWFANLQYSALRRAQGWQKWTFNFDAQKGLAITLNDRQPARFNWNITQMKGFAGIVIFGDEKAEDGQTIRVDDITVTLAGAMAVAPIAPPPPPPIVPATDPEATRKIELLPAVRGQHPRLLFTSKELEQLKENIKGPSKPFYDSLLTYLGASRAVPERPGYLTDATDGQRQGLWRTPTVGLHYALTGDKRSLEAGKAFMKHFLDTPNWETTPERDSGMSAGNIMIGAALLYDWLYHELEPDFRKAYAEKLLLQSRRMYYGGHMKGNPGPHYWQGDPQNNHRWHRNAGLALSVLAIHGDIPGTDWILEKTVDDLHYVQKWLPEDGTSHESPTYLVFGGPYLVLAFDAADRCLGTDLLGHNFFKHTAAFRLHTTTPGFTDTMHFGDSGGHGFYNLFLFRGTGRHNLADQQAGLFAYLKAQPNAFSYGWMGILWHNPAADRGSFDNFARHAFYDDIGLASFRDRWAAGGVALNFKSSAYGGLKLNEFRNTNNFAYINVAHDDPDANSFILHMDGQFVAETDRYSTKKLTSSYNTILVNDKGQRNEGQHWTQPIPRFDMTKLTKVTAYKSTPAVAAVEADAAGAYTDLERYRRAVLWVEGRYVLILDDILPRRQADITWLLQSGKVTISDAKAGRFVLTNKDATCNVQVVGTQDFEAKVGPSTADDRGNNLGFEQLQLSAKTDGWQVASVYDAWKKDASVKLERVDGALRVTVTADGKVDTWQWGEPRDAAAPSAIVGRLSDGSTFNLTLE